MLIASGALPASHRDVLINLAAEAPSGAGEFARICEIVGADEAAKRAARIRWRSYREAGLAPESQQPLRVEDDMSQPMDAIPVLTDTVEDGPGAAQPIDRTTLFLDDLEAHLSTAIHEQADELVHNACLEMEALLLEQVSDRLRAELPSRIARIVDEHFHGPARTD